MHPQRPYGRSGASSGSCRGEQRPLLQSAPSSWASWRSMWTTALIWVPSPTVSSISSACRSCIASIGALCSTSSAAAARAAVVSAVASRRCAGRVAHTFSGVGERQRVLLGGNPCRRVHQAAPQALLREGRVGDDEAACLHPQRRGERLQRRACAKKARRVTGRRDRASRALGACSVLQSMLAERFCPCLRAQQRRSLRRPPRRRAPAAWPASAPAGAARSAGSAAGAGRERSASLSAAGAARAGA